MYWAQDLVTVLVTRARVSFEVVPRARALRVVCCCRVLCRSDLHARCRTALCAHCGAEADCNGVSVASWGTSCSHVFSTPSPTNCEAEPGAITHAITCTAKKKPWPRSIIACRRSKTAKFAMQRCTRVPRDVDASVDDASREADRANSSIRTTLLDGGTVLLLQH